jgi:hypothetical protein
LIHHLRDNSGCSCQGSVQQALCYELIVGGSEIVDGNNAGEHSTVTIGSLDIGTEGVRIFRVLRHGARGGHRQSAEREEGDDGGDA